MPTPLLSKPAATVKKNYWARHNLVRHPDMPPAAFADLWQTIQGGMPWTGLV
jgi:hypothetical protein